jgi:phage head maturation protease
MVDRTRIKNGTETYLARGAMPKLISGGFGVQVLQAAIPHELAGTVDLRLEERGLVYTATMPLDQVLRDS